MPRRPKTAEERYEAVVEEFLGDRHVTRSAEGTGSKKLFGATALRINDRIFAMLTSRSAFVVKLPRTRVDELVEAGGGERFDPGHGRLMKEWLAVEPRSSMDWLALAREAREFVGRPQ